MEKLGRQWLPATHTPTVRAPQARRPLRIRLGGSGFSHAQLQFCIDTVGVDRINFLLNALETVPQEEVLNSLRTFAKHVMPHFQDSSAQAAAAGGGR